MKQNLPLHPDFSVLHAACWYCCEIDMKKNLIVCYFWKRFRRKIPVCKACCSFSTFSSWTMSLICCFSSSIAALFAESVEGPRHERNILKPSALSHCTSALLFCKSYSWVGVFVSSVKLISSPTFPAISFLWGGLLERAAYQQEKAEHQANPSSVHNTQANTSNPP